MTLGRYTTDPSSWFEPPDAVDVIQAQERFEESDAFVDAVRQWVLDGAGFDWACEQFVMTSDYDRAFEKWNAA